MDKFSSHKSDNQGSKDRSACWSVDMPEIKIERKTKTVSSKSFHCEGQVSIYSEFDLEK